MMALELEPTEMLKQEADAKLETVVGDDITEKMGEDGDSRTDAATEPAKPSEPDCTENGEDVSMCDSEEAAKPEITNGHAATTNGEVVADSEGKCEVKVEEEPMECEEEAEPVVDTFEPQEKEKLEHPLFDEEIIDGFAFCAFENYSGLQVRLYIECLNLFIRAWCNGCHFIKYLL